MQELKIGLKGEVSITVDNSVSAASVGSGLLDVFATPSMIALMEKAASSSVAPCLEEGLSTVGIKIDVEHVSATPMGMKVTVTSELIEIDRKRLIFSVSAQDEAGLIGRGTHERFIIDSDKFMAKTSAK